jgi:hypothetical protein
VEFKIPGANIAADLATLDMSGSYMLEVLDLSGSPGVTGQLSASWPGWMPYLKQLSLSGATNLVSWLIYLLHQLQRCRHLQMLLLMLSMLAVY